MENDTLLDSTMPSNHSFLHFRAMKKVKYFLKELETDKGGIKPLPKKATRNVTMAALLIEEVTRSLAKE